MDIIEKRNHTLIIIAEKLAPYVESFTFDRAAMSNGEVVKDSIQVNGANNVWSSGIITTNNGPVGAALVGSSTSTYKTTLKDDTPAELLNEPILDSAKVDYKNNKIHLMYRLNGAIIGNISNYSLHIKTAPELIDIIKSIKLGISKTLRKIFSH